MATDKSDNSDYLGNDESVNMETLISSVFLQNLVGKSPGDLDSPSAQDLLDYKNAISQYPADKEGFREYLLEQTLGLFDTFSDKIKGALGRNVSKDARNRAGDNSNYVNQQYKLLLALCHNYITSDRFVATDDGSLRFDPAEWKKGGELRWANFVDSERFKGIKEKYTELNKNIEGNLDSDLNQFADPARLGNLAPLVVKLGKEKGGEARLTKSIGEKDIRDKFSDVVQSALLAPTDEGYEDRESLQKDALKKFGVSHQIRGTKLTGLQTPKQGETPLDNDKITKEFESTASRYLKGRATPGQFIGLALANFIKMVDNDEGSKDAVKSYIAEYLPAMFSNARFDGSVTDAIKNDKLSGDEKDEIKVALRNLGYIDSKSNNTVDDYLKLFLDNDTALITNLSSTLGTVKNIQRFAETVGYDFNGGKVNKHNKGEILRKIVEATSQENKSGLANTASEIVNIAERSKDIEDLISEEALGRAANRELKRRTKAYTKQVDEEFVPRLSAADSNPQLLAVEEKIKKEELKLAKRRAYEEVGIESELRKQKLSTLNELKQLMDNGVAVWGSEDDMKTAFHRVANLRFEPSEGFDINVKDAAAKFPDKEGEEGWTKTLNDKFAGLGLNHLFENWDSVVDGLGDANSLENLFSLGKVMFDILDPIKQDYSNEFNGESGYQPVQKLAKIYQQLSDFSSSAKYGFDYTKTLDEWKEANANKKSKPDAGTEGESKPPPKKSTFGANYEEPEKEAMKVFESFNDYDPLSPVQLKYAQERIKDMKETGYLDYFITDKPTKRQQAYQEKMKKQFDEVDVQQSDEASGGSDGLSAISAVPDRIKMFRGALDQMGSIGDKVGLEGHNNPTLIENDDGQPKLKAFIDGIEQEWNDYIADTDDDLNAKGSKAVSILNRIGEEGSAFAGLLRSERLNSAVDTAALKYNVPDKLIQEFKDSIVNHPGFRAELEDSIDLPASLGGLLKERYSLERTNVNALSKQFTGRFDQFKQGLDGFRAAAQVLHVLDNRSRLNPLKRDQLYKQYPRLRNKVAREQLREFANGEFKKFGIADPDNITEEEALSTAIRLEREIRQFQEGYDHIAGINPQLVRLWGDDYVPDTQRALLNQIGDHLFDQYGYGASMIGDFIDSRGGWKNVPSDPDKMVESFEHYVKQRRTSNDRGEELRDAIASGKVPALAVQPNAKHGYDIMKFEDGEFVKASNEDIEKYAEYTRKIDLNDRTDEQKFQLAELKRLREAVQDNKGKEGMDGVNHSYNHAISELEASLTKDGVDQDIIRGEPQDAQSLRDTIGTAFGSKRDELVGEGSYVPEDELLNNYVYLPGVDGFVLRDAVKSSNKGAYKMKRGDILGAPSSEAVISRGMSFVSNSKKDPTKENDALYSLSQVHQRDAEYDGEDSAINRFNGNILQRAGRKLKPLVRPVADRASEAASGAWDAATDTAASVADAAKTKTKEGVSQAMEAVRGRTKPTTEPTSPPNEPKQPKPPEVPNAGTSPTTSTKVNNQPKTGGKIR